MALEYFEPEFPLIEDVVRVLQRELDKALWDNNETLAQQIQNTIETYNIKLSLGETHVVPF